MLSDYEREQLAQIEASLYRDPEMRALSGKRTDSLAFAKAARYVLVASIAVLWGLGTVILGVAIDKVAVGVLGFAVMLLGGTLAYRGLRGGPV